MTPLILYVSANVSQAAAGSGGGSGEPTGLLRKGYAYMAELLGRGLEALMQVGGKLTTQCMGHKFKRSASITICHNAQVHSVVLALILLSMARTAHVFRQRSYLQTFHGWHTHRTSGSHL